MSQIKPEEPIQPELYPVLQPGSWSGHASGYFSHLLSGNFLHPQLWVAYGYERRGSFHFLTKEEVREKGHKQVIAAAQRNIEGYPAAWQVWETRKGSIAFATERAFTSEKILCPDFLRQVHALLQSDEVVLSLARRNQLMAAAYDHIPKEFLGLHQKNWDIQDETNERLLSSLLLIRDGVPQHLVGSGIKLMN